MNHVFSNVHGNEFYIGTAIFSLSLSLAPSYLNWASKIRRFRKKGRFVWLNWNANTKCQYQCVFSKIVFTSRSWQSIRWRDLKIGIVLSASISVSVLHFGNFQAYYTIMINYVNYTFRIFSLRWKKNCFFCASFNLASIWFIIHDGEWWSEMAYICVSN